MSHPSFPTCSHVKSTLTVFAQKPDIVPIKRLCALLALLQQQNVAGDLLSDCARKFSILVGKVECEDLLWHRLTGLKSFVPIAEWFEAVHASVQDDDSILHIFEKAEALLRGAVHSATANKGDFTSVWTGVLNKFDRAQRLRVIKFAIDAYDYFGADELERIVRDTVKLLQPTQTADVDAAQQSAAQKRNYV